MEVEVEKGPVGRFEQRHSGDERLADDDHRWRVNTQPGCLWLSPENQQSDSGDERHEDRRNHAGAKQSHGVVVFARQLTQCVAPAVHTRFVDKGSTQVTPDVFTVREATSGLLARAIRPGMRIDPPALTQWARALEATRLSRYVDVDSRVARLAASQHLAQAVDSILLIFGWIPSGGQPPGREQCANGQVRCSEAAVHRRPLVAGCEGAPPIEFIATLPTAGLHLQRLLLSGLL
jgi:hypothetical protein